MTRQDAEDAWAAGQVAFEDRGEHWPESTVPPEVRWRRGVEVLLHLLETDPGGLWVAEDEGGIRGLAAAIVREDVWGLSILAVEPSLQGNGLGGALFERALAHGRDTRGQIIMSSQDPRAMRRYVRAGFALLPAMAAFGSPVTDGLAVPAPVRPGDLEDIPLTEAVDRGVRGAPHGRDIAHMLAAGGKLHVVPERGYAVHADGSPRLLAALDEDAARALLATVFSHAPAGIEAGVLSLTSDQSWAVEVATAAGLDLETSGPTFVRGDLGPLTHYLPNPAFL